MFSIVDMWHTKYPCVISLGNNFFNKILAGTPLQIFNKLLNEKKLYIF